MNDADGLLDRLTSGHGIFDESLRAAADALPLELLAGRLATCDGPAACDLAYLLARREDPRGLAALARAVTQLRTAWRAWQYLAELDLLDLVPDDFLTPERLDLARAVDVLGAEPEALEPLVRGLAPWPGQAGGAEALVCRYRLPAHPTGLILVRPLVLTVEGGVATLDADDALALLCGLCHPQVARRVPLDLIDRESVAVLVKRRAYRMLAAPRLAGAHEVSGDLVLTVAVQSRGRPGYLVGDVAGRVALHFLAAGPADDPLSADQAFRLWLGRMLLAGL